MSTRAVIKEDIHSVCGSRLVKSIRVNTAEFTNLIEMKPKFPETSALMEKHQAAL